MGDQDTAIGAGKSAFGTTQWNEILQARRLDDPAVRQCLAHLAEIYWRPVYKYIRIQWGKDNEEAKDLTQEFFAKVFGPEFLARADPARGRFRTFVLASVRNFLRDYEKLRDTVKRGGEAFHVPVEAAVEEGLLSLEPSAEEAFRVSWAESLLAAALADLERTLAERGRQKVFDVFRAYCLEAAPDRRASYHDLAQDAGVSVSDVTNSLALARRELRSILLRKVEPTVASREDADGELRELFGI